MRKPAFALIAVVFLLTGCMMSAKEIQQLKSVSAFVVYEDQAGGSRVKVPMSLNQKKAFLSENDVAALGCELFGVGEAWVSRTFSIENLEWGTNETPYLRRFSYFVFEGYLCPKKAQFLVVPLKWAKEGLEKNSLSWLKEKFPAYNWEYNRMYMSGGGTPAFKGVWIVK